MSEKVTKGGFCDSRKGEKTSEQKTLGVTEKRHFQKRGHEGNNHHNACYKSAREQALWWPLSCRPLTSCCTKGSFLLCVLPCDAVG